MFGITTTYACPMCSVDGKDLSLPIIGTFLLVPYVVFLVAFLIVRKLLKQIETEHSSDLSLSEV